MQEIKVADLMLMVDSSQTHMKAETFTQRLQLDPEIPMRTDLLMQW